MLKKSIYFVLNHIATHGSAIPPSYLDNRKWTFFLSVSNALSLNLNCILHCSRKVLRYSCASLKGETEILKEGVAAVVVMVMGGMD